LRVDIRRAVRHVSAPTASPGTNELKERGSYLACMEMRYWFKFLIRRCTATSSVASGDLNSAPPNGHVRRTVCCQFRAVLENCGNAIARVFPSLASFGERREVGGRRMVIISPEILNFVGTEVLLPGSDQRLNFTAFKSPRATSYPSGQRA